MATILVIVAGILYPLIKSGTLAGLSTVMLTTLLGQSRIFFVMSRDGLLPPWVGAIHPRFRTPWISSIVVGLFIATFAGLLPISILGDLVSIGTLFAFVIVCLILGLVIYFGYSRQKNGVVALFTYFSG